MAAHPPTPPEDPPSTLAGAVGRGALLWLRDAMLHGVALLSIVVGVGGVLVGGPPVWVWLGPVLGVAGVLAWVAVSRARAWSERRTWVVVLLALAVQLVATWLVLS